MEMYGRLDPPLPLGEYVINGRPLCVYTMFKINVLLYDLYEMTYNRWYKLCINTMLQNVLSYGLFNIAMSVFFKVIYDAISS